MFVRPDVSDLRLIGFYLGKVVTGLGLLIAVPAALALVLGEWNALTALAVGAALSVAFGAFARLRLHTRAPLEWSHSMVIVALAWLLGSLLAAVPLYLSGHYGDALDAVFEAMSGLTATGLTVVQDLDHLPRSLNLYRHLMHFAGGQGIVIVVLSLFAAGGTRIGALYAGEGREERILPSFIRTARFIFRVAGTYLVLGTVALTIASLVAGLPPAMAAFHAVTLFMTSFDTAGFAPQSTSIAYYHSIGIEVVTMVLMVAGAISFGLHFQLWRRSRRTLVRHIETQVLALSTLGLAAVAMVGLSRSGALTGVEPLMRKGFYTLVSAQTSTGLTVFPGRLFVTDWGTLAPAAIVAAMALGGMASSTAGGMKTIRLGIAAKSLIRDVRRVLLPESALVVQTYHANRRHILRDEVVRSAFTILSLYMVSFLVGTMVGLAYGRWDVTETIFESVSATANGGLSVGIVSVGMPHLLQLVYLVQMWIGRLEFMAVFALLGYVVALFRGRT